MPSIDFSNCNKLRSFAIYEFEHYDKDFESTLNISGWIYESEDGYIRTHKEQFVFINNE